MRSGILKQLNQEMAEGRAAVLVTILATNGSTPRKAGSQMLVLSDGSIRGTIGGGLVEARAMEEAGRAFQSRRSSVQRFSMNAKVAAADGMACGGDMEFFVQYIEDPPSGDRSVRRAKQQSFEGKNMSQDIYQRSIQAHRQVRGKLAVQSKMPLENTDDLSLAYTPGVAGPCLAIAENPDMVYELTSKWNTVAVVTDGSAVLGLGDIGPAASLPVMEGKCALFKRFADIEAIPLAIATRSAEEIIHHVSQLTSSWGGINLEDIAAPRCFEIEEKLQALCDIPVFHDDQHGTAVITAAGLMNALKLAEKKLEEVKIVVSGSGAAGNAVVRFLLAFGARRVVVCNRGGAIWRGRPGLTNWALDALAQITNPDNEKGSLAEVLKGADVFIGLSAPGLVTPEMVKAMTSRAIVLALANPAPEIYPAEALAAGALVVGTGRSDFPNQFNNCLGFPGLFRGALDTRARVINEEMKMAAARALTGLIAESDLRPDYIIPSIFDSRVVPAIAAGVAAAARASGVARA